MCTSIFILWHCFSTYPNHSLYLCLSQSLNEGMRIEADKKKQLTEQLDAAQKNIQDGKRKIQDIKSKIQE